MQLVEFQNRLSVYPVFSLRDALKMIPGLNRIQLDRWEKKGYLKKIRRGFYRLGAQELNQDSLFYTANKIYAPSYVSLETALKYYGLIPEEIFQITSVSVKKATHFETPVGNFRYRHIKPSLFWGYQLVNWDKQKLLLAEPEKAVLDYLYVNTKLRTAHDFQGMRINTDEFQSRINLERFQQYLGAFQNKRLARQANLFLATIQDDHT